MMKLDESDYENIFLRVRAKLWKQALAVLVALFVIFGITSVYVAKQRIESTTESAVNRYIESESFRREILSVYRTKLSELENKAAEIAQAIGTQEKRAAQLSQVPIAIDENTLVVTDKNGNKFQMETGTAKSASKILFKNVYKGPPVVIVSEDVGPLNLIQLERIRRRGAQSFALNASSTGFEIPGDVYGTRYRWVAFGP